MKSIRLLIMFNNQLIPKLPITQTLCKSSQMSHRNYSLKYKNIQVNKCQPTKTTFNRIVSVLTNFSTMFRIQDSTSRN
jgi:hypothetical protein